MTIRGITRQITLVARLNGVETMTYGPKAKLGFTATGSFDRRDYGIEFNIPFPPAATRPKASSRSARWSGSASR